jgi:hypothetical protein
VVAQESQTGAGDRTYVSGSNNSDMHANRGSNKGSV